MLPSGQLNKRHLVSHSFYAGDTSLVSKLNSSNPFMHAQVEADLLNRTERALDYLKELTKDLETTRRELLNKSIDDKENTSFNLKQQNSFSVEDLKRSPSLLQGTLNSTQKSLKTRLLQIVEIVSDLQKYSYLKTQTKLPSDLSFANLDLIPSKKSLKTTRQSQKLKDSIILELENLVENIEGEKGSNNNVQPLNSKAKINAILESRNDDTLLFVPVKTWIPSTFVDDSIEGLLFREENNKLFQDISPIHVPGIEPKCSGDYWKQTSANRDRCEDKIIQNNLFEDNHNDLQFGNTGAQNQSYRENIRERSIIDNKMDNEKEMSTELSIEFEVANSLTEKLNQCDSSSIQKYDMLLEDLEQVE